MQTSLFFLVVLAFFGCSNALKCYLCTSQVDKDCDGSDLTALKGYITDCVKLKDGAMAGNEAIGCRKIVQTVDSERSTVRECAYSGENVDGLRKTGNWGINLKYYQCSNAKPEEACNGSAGIFSIGFLVISAIFALQY